MSNLLLTVAPERSNINVFSKGTSHALSVSIPFGGHIAPISIVGFKLAVKKAQKKARQKEKKEAERIEKEFSKDLDEDDISLSNPPPLPQRQSTRVRDTKKGSDKEKKESSNSKSAVVKSVDKKPLKK